jgi:hypothetical protein
MGVIWLVKNATQGIWDTYLIWPVVALVSIMSMHGIPLLFGALRLPATMSRFRAWVGLLALILTAPLVLPPGGLLVLVELTLGLIFSLYYVAITSVLKGVNWPATRAGRHTTHQP